MSDLRIDPHRALIAAIEDRYGRIDNLASVSRAWSSATFVGARHSLSFDIADPSALRRTIVDTEFSLPGHFVADISLIQVDGGAVKLEALTIEDA